MQKRSACANGFEQGFVSHLLIFGLFILIFVMALSFVLMQSRSGVSKTPAQQVIANPLPTIKPVSAENDAIEVQKLYTNNELGFEFSYDSQKYEAKMDTEADYFQRTGGDSRKNYTYYVGYAPGEVMGAVDLLDRSDPNPENSPFLVWVFNNPGNLDAATWFRKYWYYPFNWGQFERAEKAKLAPDTEATVSGQLANWGQIPYQLGEPKYYYIVKDGRMYLIRELNDDQTINSFKFL
jgi:hypothetical protein